MSALSRPCRPGRRTLPGVLWATLLPLTVPQVCHASTGGLITLPLPRVAAPAGLSLQLDATWVNGFGYRPIRITINAANPPVADQSLRFELVAHGQANNGNVRVLQEVELPAGAASVQATIRLPQHDSIQFLWWNVHIDGVFAPELSIDKQTPVSIANTVGTGNVRSGAAAVDCTRCRSRESRRPDGSGLEPVSESTAAGLRIGPGSSPLQPPAASFFARTDNRSTCVQNRR